MIKKTTLAIFMAGLMLVTTFSAMSVNAAVGSYIYTNVKLVNDDPSDHLDGMEESDLDITLEPFDPSPSPTNAPGEYYAVIAACAQYKDPSSNLPVQEYKLKNLYRGLISNNNWNSANIRLLINEDATKANIIAALNEMAGLVTQNDVFLFSWQGHGSKVPESETSGSNDDFETDGYDEVICPYNCKRNSNGNLQNYITDDELDYLFDNINAEGMMLIFESCYSGGLVSSNKLFNLNDVDAAGRVVIVSTLDGTLGRASWIFGFPMTWTIGEAFDRKSIFGGPAEDNDNDGFISAEEAFKWARPKIFIENSILWAGLWMYFFLMEYEFQKYNSTNALEAALIATATVFAEWCYVQLYTILMSGGDLMINYPHMIDYYPGRFLNREELPMVPVTDTSNTKNSQMFSAMLLQRNTNN